jgi:transcriptional regulator with XRE-family HTH domain
MDRKTDDDVLDAVGPRLRALRRDRGITLADLAATTGVSESSLSRPESGRRRPSLALLLPPARIYDVPLDDLVGSPRTGDPRIDLEPIRRFGTTFVPLSRKRGRGTRVQDGHPRPAGTTRTDPADPRRLRMALLAQRTTAAHDRRARPDVAAR